MDDPFELQRFVEAHAEVYEHAVAEVRSGRKRSHWMWFVFPQLAGLGSSPMAQRYAITGLDEARAYLAHPVLGSRLRDCVAAAVSVVGRTAHDIFGSPDDLKFRSCLTLFAEAAPDEPVFRAALDRFYGGEADPQTLARLRRR